MNSLKTELIKVDEINDLDSKTIEKIYTENINPGQVHYLKLLGFNKVLMKRGKGVYYYDQNDEKILDFSGGVGSIGLGHNHPRINNVRKKFQDEERHEIGMSFYSQYAAALSKNLANICPADLDVVILANCGSEAIEQAIKMVEKYQGPLRSKLVYAINAFHGRTKGALSITDSKILRNTFKLHEDNIKVPFGEYEAIETALKDNPDIGGIFLESIQGGAGVIVPPKGYLKKVRELCDQYGVLLILDEIQCGFGRTGKMFAFEHDEVVPDIITISKSFGGTKASVAATIVRTKVYKKAYKDKKDFVAHLPSTFGGMGGACVTSIEAINILYEEDLISKARDNGKYFIEELRILKERYPKIIKDVRGRGLMIGMEYHDISNTLIPPFNKLISSLDDRIKGSLSALLGGILLNKYNILVSFTEFNRNVHRIYPPYISSKEDYDYFISSMDELLSKGIKGIISNFLKLKL
jgi:acetylornithine/succinyldiaminopimelate/putrescine aminotransferase